MKTYCLVGLSLFLLLPLHAGNPTFSVEPAIEVAGSGGFDYVAVDPVNRRFMANHTHNGTLDLFDVETGKAIQTISVGAVQGSVYVSKNNRYYASISEQQKVAVIDAASFKVLVEIPLTGPADGIFYNATTGLIYVGHDDGPDLWVIDPATNKIVFTAPIGAGPEGIGTDATGKLIYQNCKATNTLEVIAADSGKVLNTWSTLPAENPHGLIVDSANGHLIVFGKGKIVILNASTGQVVSSQDAPAGVDAPGFDEGTGLIYAPSKAGTMTVYAVVPSGVQRVTTLKTTVGEKTCAVDGKTHTVWTAYGNKATGKSYIQKIVTQL